MNEDVEPLAFGIKEIYGSVPFQAGLTTRSGRTIFILPFDHGNVAAQELYSIFLFGNFTS